ncbi:MAG: alpha/beta hydrolase-fold protein, partial [Cyclobacteriaceae bacterium]|nr:alpha/beta hydrolase-fold protein [Cyclobacteriaceae bacterium]
MIIAMPDGGVTFYVNSYDEKELWEDFFIQEFIPFIDKTYHTRAEKQFRAVAGLSMGGHGALIFGLKHPELFAASAPLSAGVLTEKEFIDMAQNSWDNVWGIPYGKGLVGKKRISDHMKNNWAISLVENGNTEEQKKVKYYIDCGDDDFLVRGNLALKLAMMDKGIEHEFRMRQGGHSWSYWRTALPDVLLFVSESFRR